jgi:anti-sigma factor RsiW
VGEDERRQLIHAEIDGELGAGQRGDLARLLLADPEARALRDQLQGLSKQLEALGETAPPPELQERILSRLPPATASGMRRWQSRPWRLAALIAGLVTAGSIVYQVAEGPGSVTDTVGTLTSGGATMIDSVALDAGPVAGRASLYRDKTELAVALEVFAAEPVDVLVTASGYSLRINDLRSASPGEPARRTVPLAVVAGQPGDIELTFLVEGRLVSHTTLHAPPAP